MATEVLDATPAHVRSVTVTSLASLAGVAAALVSSAVASGPTDILGLYVVAGFVAVQLPILRALGIDVEDFSTKDYLYVGFMTFALWFVTWGILLTSGTSVTL